MHIAAAVQVLRYLSFQRIPSEATSRKLYLSKVTVMLHEAFRETVPRLLVLILKFDWTTKLVKLNMLLSFIEPSSTEKMETQ